MTNKITVLLIILRTLLNGQVGLATSFQPKNDPWNPDPGLACEHGRPLTNKDLVVAHRTLPCGSRIYLYNPRTNRSVWAKVGDRGPYGKRRTGEFRAMVDLAPATTRALRSNGYETIIMYAPTP